MNMGYMISPQFERLMIHFMLIILLYVFQGRGITTYDTLDPSVEHQDGCRIMIQNVGATTKDEPCGKPTPQNYAGLCE